MNPKNLEEFKEYLQQELDYGWTVPSEWSKGFDDCLKRYIGKLEIFINLKNQNNDKGTTQKD